MPVVATHHRRDDEIIDFSDEKQLALQFELPLDVLLRIIPRAKKITSPPQVDYRGRITLGEFFDLHAQRRKLRETQCAPLS